MAHPPRTIEQIKQRIHEMTKIDPVTGCWVWQGKKSHGYGHLRVKGGERLAHRMAYRIFKGDIPEGLGVLHDCDNPACCNPDHLHLGTQADNVREMHERNRAGKARGEKAGNHVFTDEDVIRIREIYASKEMTPGQLAKHFDVSVPAIHAVITGKTWRHVEGFTGNIRRNHIGENHHGAVVDEAMVLELRRLYDVEKVRCADLARMFPINYNTIYSIVRRQYWKHLP